MVTVSLGEGEEDAGADIRKGGIDVAVNCSIADFCVVGVLSHYV
jgi:hypothetical protein